MLDLLFDTNLDEETPSTTRAVPVSHKKHPQSSFEEETISAVELAHSIYSLHGNANPLELMRILSSVDSQFLSDHAHSNTEQEIAEMIIGMFL